MPKSLVGKIMTAQAHPVVVNHTRYLQFNILVLDSYSYKWSKTLACGLHGVAQSAAL